MKIIIDGQEVECCRGADGKDAYQLYAEGGGTLTKEQWLASLAQGAPEYAQSVDAMRDTDKIYVGRNGNLWVYGDIKPVDQIPLSVDTDGKPFGTAGLMAYRRWTSSGTLVSSSDADTTGLIPCAAGDTFYLSKSGLYDLSGNEQHRLTFFSPDRSYVAYWQPWKVLSAYFSDVIFNSDGEITAFSTPTAGYFAITGLNADGVSKIGKTEYLSAESFVSSNQAVGGEEKGWADTGIKYANYALSDADREIIAQKVLDILDVSYVSIENSIQIGTYTLRYDGSEGTADIGVVTA